MFNDVQYLKVNLPEDILNLKSRGNFKEAIKVIEMRLEKKLPYSLRKRLEIEKEIIEVLEGEYTYSYEDALNLLQSKIKDFKEEELINLKNHNILDWHFKEGKVYFIESFYNNLILTEKEYANRVLIKENDEKNILKQKLLDDNVVKMKENGHVAYRFHIEVTLKIEKSSVREGNVIKVHLPIPNEATQVKNINIIKTTPQAKIIAPIDTKNRTVYFEEVLREGDEFVVEYSYENHMEYKELNPRDVNENQPDFYTKELAPHIMFTPYIKELLNEIIGNENNPLIKARKIYDFITTNVNYSYVRKYFTILNIPEYAAVNLKGDCGIQALLFITLCRCANIPAKWQSGLYVTPYHVGCHDWAQFYIAPYGWLFADLSFGGSSYRNNKLDRWNFYFGNLDPYRMCANSEFQQEFYPKKNYTRHDPYDNQCGECEYEDRGLRREEYVTTNNLINISEIAFVKS